MGVFYVFKIVQMIPKRATHHIFTLDIPTVKNLSIFQGNLLKNLQTSDKNYEQQEVQLGP